jgi:hypothetical protein
MRESGSSHGAPADGITSSDYDAGYAQAAREATWARLRGWTASERQLTVMLMRAARIYASVRGGKSVAGQSPEWLRGRLDALRALVRQRAADEHRSDSGD